MWDNEDPRVVGSVVLVGVSYFDENEERAGQQQFWGTILAFNPEDGLKVDLGNLGEAHVFPPFRDALEPAEPGEYRLRSTGEAIQDPDYLYQIAVYDPKRL